MAVDGDIVSVSFKAKIVEKLGCGWMAWLQIPCFVKDGMVARLYDAGSEVKVDNILGGRSIAKEDAGKVVKVQLTLMDAGAFDTHL
jgi:hypothetical protein